jgi:hypothetical protein
VAPTSKGDVTVVVVVLVTVDCGDVVVSACFVTGGKVTVVVTCSVVVLVVQAPASAIEPNAAPPTIKPASFKNSRLDNSLAFVLFSDFSFAIFISLSQNSCSSIYHLFSSTFIDLLLKNHFVLKFQINI